jgi:predicted ester cyclase
MSHPAMRREEKEELELVVPKTAIPLDILREGSNRQKGVHSMSTEENKTLMRRFFEEVYTKKNLAAIGEFIVPTHIDHSAAAAGLPVGPEGSRQAIGMMLTGFPDLHITVEDMIAEGDKVVVRLTMRGTRAVSAWGYSPNGQAGGGLDHRYGPHRRRQDCGRVGSR